MIHIITSNSVPVRSIYDYIDNFQIVHHTKRPVPVPFSDMIMKHVFQVYIHEMDSIVHSLDEIANGIIDQWKKEKASGEEEETIIVVACSPEWNHAACRYLDKRIQAKGLDTGCMNLYKTLHVMSTESMKKIVSNTLNTDMIYPEEPVPFAYALDRALIGLV